MMSIEWPPKQFTEQVDIEAKNLARLAESLFSSPDNEHSRIWAFLLLHLNQSAHCNVCTIWADAIIQWTMRPVSFVVAAAVMPHTKFPSLPKLDFFWCDILLLLTLFVSYTIIYYSSKRLHNILNNWDPPYGPAVHPPRPIIGLSICIIVAFLPKLLLQVAVFRGYHPSWLVQSYVNLLLTLGTSVALIEILCLIGHASLSSFIYQNIYRQHLPSQLPWALASALAQISNGDPNQGLYYNWLAKDIDYNRFRDVADRIHQGLDRTQESQRSDPAVDEERTHLRTVKQTGKPRTALAKPEEISACVRETLKTLNVWMYPLFKPAPVTYVGTIRDNSVRLTVKHPIYKPISADMYAKIENLQSTLKQLSEDSEGLPLAIKRGRWPQMYDPKTIEDLESARKNYKEALRQVTSLLKNSEFTSEFTETKPDPPLDNYGARWHVLHHLETAAKTIGAIPLLLPKASQTENRWISQVYAERAEAVRELKTWVALPLDCTKEDLKKKLRTILITITDGNWGALEQRPLPADPETPFWERAFKIARKVVIALAPLGLFLILDTAFHSNVDASKVNSGLEDGIRNLVIAWTGLSVLALLDPGFAAKISSFKDVKEFVSSNKGETSPPKGK
jgi:hypothetical protein